MIINPKSKEKNNPEDKKYINPKTDNTKTNLEESLNIKNKQGHKN